MSNLSNRVGVAALAAFAIGVAACGGDDGTENEAAAAGAAKVHAHPVAVADLDPFLMRKGEEPGFRPGAAPGAMPRARGTITGVQALASEMHLPASDQQRLSSEGFVSTTFQPIRGPRSAGVTNVSLYETAEGAKRSQAHDLRPDVIREGGRLANLRFFAVPGVPGARGWTASLSGEPASHAVGNVLWVQGRCMHVLGNQGPGPLAGPLAKGARAIYERTDGECP